MASDKSRRIQGAHARKAYTCSECGKVVHGNGARASHRAAHERRGEDVLMRMFRPGDRAGREDA